MVKLTYHLCCKMQKSVHAVIGVELGMGIDDVVGDGVGVCLAGKTELCMGFCEVMGEGVGVGSAVRVELGMDVDDVVGEGVGLGIDSAMGSRVDESKGIYQMAECFDEVS